MLCFSASMVTGFFLETYYGSVTQFSQADRHKKRGRRRNPLSG